MLKSAYYTAEAYLINRLERFGGQMRHKAKDLPSHLSWKSELRGRLSEAIGLTRMQPCDLNARLLEEVAKVGYLQRKIIIQTEPEVYMPFYMLVPDDIKPGEQRAAVLAPHGHGSCGKYETAGCVEIPGITGAIAQYNGDYGVQLVKKGFIVFCPDARGFGERRERNFWSDDPTVYMDEYCRTCTELNRIAVALGQSLIGMWVWDLMRLTDYAQSCLECDPQRIGCAGLSGGGMQTLWLSALDERIRACIVSGYYYGFCESLLEMPQCSCNYAPGVWELIDISDLGALVAPRPMTIETGSKDPLNGRSGLDNVVPYVQKAACAYALFGAEHNLAHDIFEGVHRWSGAHSIKRLQDSLSQSW